MENKDLKYPKENRFLTERGDDSGTLSRCREFKDGGVPFSRKPKNF